MSERSLPPSTTPDFAMLVTSIAELHRTLAAHAARAVNMSLTLRNWLIGAYIREYEQQGADRVQYGEALLERLSRALADGGTIRYHPRELGRCRTFYATYPQIRGALSPESDVLPPARSESRALRYSRENRGPATMLCLKMKGIKSLGVPEWRLLLRGFEA